MGNEKERAKLEMRIALIKLQDAWLDCLHTFGSIHLDANDYIVGDVDAGDAYPFDKSFDELEVIPWIEGTIRRLDADVED